MAIVDEVAVFNKIALYENTITGVDNSFGFASNPDAVNRASLPVVIHYSPGFRSEPGAHHNVWKNTLNVQSALLVVPRQLKSGQLSLLEAQTVPYGLLWRKKFQTASVVNDMLSLGLTHFSLDEGRYGVGNSAGNSVLTWGGVDYFGWVFTFTLIERN